MNARSLCAAVLVPAAALLPDARAASLIVNGGFEEGLAGWTPDPAHEIVSDPAKAFEGSKCLTGELTAPSRALTLRQNVKVRAGCAYEIGFAVRGRPGLRFGFWATFPGKNQRDRIEIWDDLTARWQRHTATFNPGADGLLKLEVIAPSTHGGGEGGRIWVDDITLTETVLPRFTDVSAGEGFNDEPAFARAADGSLYAAWVSFRNGHDTLQLARFAREGADWKRTGAWPVEVPAPAYVLQPRLVATRNGVALLAACEARGNWDVHAWFCGPGGPGRTVTVGADAATDVKPAGAAAPDGRLWVAWESNRGGKRRILAASVSGDGQMSPAEALSDAAFNACDPDIAVGAAGAVHVAWHDFRAGRCDIRLRSRGADGAWAPERQVTGAPAVDRHARLLTRGDDLWLLYETAQVKEYHVGSTVDRRMKVLKVTPDQVLAPVCAGPCPLDLGSEGADAAFDADGRLWVAFLRTPAAKAIGWHVLLTCFNGGRWTPAVVISKQKGMDRRPWLALDGRTALVGGQSDDMPHSWTNEEASLVSRSDIWLAAKDVSDAPAADAVKFAAPVESPEPFAPADLHAARGEDLPTTQIEYQGSALKLFFGDLHHHTDVSPCGRTRDQTLDEGYQHMRDLAVHDFACATDHGYGLNPYLWNYTAKMARANNDPGRYLTFLGEEWTSTFEEYSVEHPYGFYGHRNLILADAYFPRWWNAKNRQTPAHLWEDLRRMNANFVNIPHQLADTGNVPTDWNFTDEVAQPVAEIFQTRGSYEHPGAPRAAKNTTPKGWFLQDAWARGIVIGVIASPDHGGGYGKACVYAPELTREAILDALRARRCYGTTAAKIALDVRVAGRLMGEKTADAPPAVVPVDVRVKAPGDLDRVEVCRNNEYVYSRSFGGRECSFTFADRAPVKGRSYYYVRVVQKDEEVAWSSPVWFGAK